MIFDVDVRLFNEIDPFWNSASLNDSSVNNLVNSESTRLKLNTKTENFAFEYVFGWNRFTFSASRKRFAFDQSYRRRLSTLRWPQA